MRSCFNFLVPFVISLCCNHVSGQEILYKSPEYTLYKDRVVQGKYEAKADKSSNLISDYQSTASEMFSRDISFKFSINEKDNEMPFGQNHHVIVGEGEHQSGVIKFGSPYASIPAASPRYLEPNYSYTFRLDGREVLRQLNTQGFYIAADGSKIAKSDFKGFFIAGSAEPLSWDFVNLEEKGLMLRDNDGDGIYEITLVFNPVAGQKEAQRLWKPQRDLSGEPKYSSGQPIVDALFRMATDEALIAIEPDSTFRTGAKWGGVWTRDVSYSILLSMAFHQPDVAKISLMRKVKRGRIVQDTGSGGAWPVSSDRTVWAIAAWEIYKVTGDRDWLKQCYPIIKKTLEDDYKTLYDPATGLYRGESSFLDWREQTYPRWMNNADIFMSECLGTNAVHYQANIIAAKMAELLGEDESSFRNIADGIRQGINQWLWQQEKGYYGQYLYGGNSPVLSGRYEALGESLAILFGIADEARAKEIIGRSPMTPFGATCIYPQIPNIPAYHNNAVWPFVQAYWNLAAAKAGNETVLNHGMASIYRPAALFLTNYENFVAQNGDYVGTEVNSDRMLWSMCGNLAMVYRVLLGMEFEKEGIKFSPSVPKGYDGDKKLSNFSYREALLDITVKGYGNTIKSFSLDGKQQQPFLPGEIKGRHSVEIVLDNKSFEGKMNLVANEFSPETLLVENGGSMLAWNPAGCESGYIIYKDGKEIAKTTALTFDTAKYGAGCYAVAAADMKGSTGFVSSPLYLYPKKSQFVVEAETAATKSILPYTGYNGKGFIAMSKTENTKVTVSFTVPEDRDYLIDFSYSNGNGPWNTDTKCAIRSLYVNSGYCGAVVMPQRGTGEWSNWGFSNRVRVSLKKGINRIALVFEEWNNNMNVDENTAMLDYCRLLKL